MRSIIEKWTNEQVADTCDEAADYIEQHGWCQTVLFDNDGQACLYGALYYGAGVVLGIEDPKARVIGEDAGIVADPEYNDQDYLGLRALTATNHQLEREDSIAWNDMPGRKEQEVLDVLRATAKAHR